MHFLLLVAVVLAFSESEVAPASLDRGAATITTSEGERISLRVEIARTQAERSRGLMHRRALPARSGMVFVYPQESSGGFWMMNTLIPLDIAFLDARGKILRILTMTPCRAERCRIYNPGVRYRSALEVNAGSFRRWHVKAGNVVAVRSTSKG